MDFDQHFNEIRQQLRLCTWMLAVNLALSSTMLGMVLCHG